MRFSITSTKSRFMLLVLATLGLGLVLPQARADIMVSPTRIVLDQNSRQATITLRNPGTVDRTYRLRWSERRMDPQGGIEVIPDGQNPTSVVNMVRFSPRRIVVPAGQLQTIRLDYRPPVDLAPGEYRSHLIIGLEPEQSGTAVMNETQKGMTIKLEALISFSLPVMVRHGTGNANLAINSVAPDTVDGGYGPSPALKVNLTRSGAFGSYGRLTIYQQLDANSPVQEIGRAGNVAIYAETTQVSRVVTLKEGVNLKPGSWIRVAYEGEGQEAGQIFAEQSFKLE